MPDIVIKEYHNFKEAEIFTLYQSVGWTNYTGTPSLLSDAFAHSLKTLAAYDEEKLVGIARAVGDGASIVYLQDILVLPDYQRRGVGSALVKQMIKIYEHVYQMVLMTDSTPKTIGFYQSLGFQSAAEIGCTAFFKIH